MNNDIYKFYYFNVNGRGAPIRALLQYLKIQYENIRISEETDQWPKLKASGIFEYLQIPALEINGKMYVQTNSILRYLAKKHNLMGKTPEDEYEINNILDSTEDLWHALFKFIFPDNDQMRKAKDTYKQVFIEKVAHYLKVYQKKYEAHGKKKYLLGDQLTLADIHIPICLHSFTDYFQKTAPWKDNAPEIFSILEKNAKEDLKDFFEKGDLAIEQGTK